MYIGMNQISYRLHFFQFDFSTIDLMDSKWFDGLHYSYVHMSIHEASVETLTHLQRKGIRCVIHDKNEV